MSDEEAQPHMPYEELPPRINAWRVLMVVLLLWCGSALAADNSAAGYCAIDTDHNGTYDHWCPAPDQDDDGYTTDGTREGYDCLDTDPMVYPGIYTASGCDAGYYHYCDADGNFKDGPSGSSTVAHGGAGCVNTTLCEKTGSGRCRYIKAGTDGVDCSNSWNGTVPVYTSGSNGPWCNQLMITDYPYTTPPSGSITPGAGDFIYFLDGTYSDTYTDGWVNYSRWLVLRGNDCTQSNPCGLKAYPGHHPKILYTSNFTSNNEATINLSDANYWLVEGFEIDGADLNGTGSTHMLGIDCDSSTGCEVRNNIVHNIRGNYDNLGGIQAHTVTNYNIHHNKVYDVKGHNGGSDYNGPGDNLFMIFRGSGTLAYNEGFNTNGPPSAAATQCFKQKHADYLSTITIKGNKFGNCGEDWGWGWAGGNGSMRNNRMLNARVGKIADWGGTSFQYANDITNNSFLDSYGTKLLDYNPQQGYNTNNTGAANACSGSGVIGQFTFEKNIITGSSLTTGTEVYYYGPKALYDASWGAGLIDYINNTWPASTAFDIFTSNNADTSCSGRSGGQAYTTSQWIAAGQDTTSTFGSPGLDSNGMTTDGRGWRQASGGSPTPTPTPTATPTATPTSTPTATPTPEGPTAANAGYRGRFKGKR